MFVERERGAGGGITLFPQVLICLFQNGINQFPRYIIPWKHLFSCTYTPVLSDEQKYKVIIELQQPHLGNKSNYVFRSETNQREKTRREKKMSLLGRYVDCFSLAGGVVEPACWLPDVTITCTHSGHCPALFVHRQHVPRHN